jgi:hypothetical protein
MTKKTPTPRIPAAYIALIEKSAPLVARENNILQYEKESLANYRAKIAALWAEFTPAIGAIFDAVNGKADSFTLRLTAALELAIDTERRLDAMGVPKAFRSGVEVYLSSAGPSASSYKYRAAGTEITLRRNSKGDYDLIKANRIEVSPKQASRSHITVSPAARDAIIRNALGGIIVA